MKEQHFQHTELEYLDIHGLKKKEPQTHKGAMSTAG